MRLDFNLVVVDDDWDDVDKKVQVTNLINKIKGKVESKGFELKDNCYSTADEAFSLAHKRVDLYLSDNNLGDNSNHENPEKENEGIDYYLKLRKQRYLCDFVLYTKSGWNEIVNKLAQDLTTNKRPDLFSRFTFVSREGGKDDWHSPIIDLLDHILTKREELNNLRGLYAQRISKMDEDLKTKFPATVDLKLKKTIDFIPDSVIDSQNRKMLHKVREIRNGLMHNEEEMCTLKNQYVVRFTGDDNVTLYEVYENELQMHREILNIACSFVMSLP